MSGRVFTVQRESVTAFLKAVTKHFDSHTRFWLSMFKRDWNRESAKEAVKVTGELREQFEV